MPKRLTLIDGSGFIFRAFFALPKFTNKAGTPTGAVYGFVNMMQKLMRDAENNEFDDYMAVIFDAGRHTFRNDLYSEYKANRDEPPEELRPQFALVREATVALGLPAIELAGVEADDLIATYTRHAQAAGFDEIIIVSSDKDLMQLVEDKRGTTMFDAMKSKIIDEAGVFDKFAVMPHKVRDVLALMGDSSDNIPGVPGIGPKTASQLIDHFGDLESLLNRAEEEVPQKKRKEMLMTHADKARLSYTLVGLKEDCDVPVALDQLQWMPKEEGKLKAFLQEMGFRKLIEKMDGGEATSSSSENVIAPQTAIPQPSTINYQLLDEAGLSTMLAKAEAKGHVALALLETGIALCVEAGQAGYFEFSRQESGVSHQDDLFGENSESRIQNSESPIIQSPNHPITQTLTHPAIMKIGYQIKTDSQQLGAIAPQTDITLQSYILNAGLHSHDLDKIIQRECEQALTSKAEILGKGRSKLSWSEVEPEKLTAYACERADFTLRAWQRQTAQIQREKLLSVYEKIERPLLPILSQMEQRGILVDRTYLKQLSSEFAVHVAALEKEIFALAGQEFLISSPKQLGEVLFDSLGIEGGKKSKKSGQYSTGAEVLEELAAQGHVIAQKVTAWRSYEKLRSTYTDALQKQIDAKTGRVHTRFMQTVAATGRLSSTDPNLQNIPIRTAEGARIRQAFIAPKGKKLISADYSQIELRLLAEMADMPVLKDAFKNKLDIHAATASQMFGISLDEMTPEYRRRAKTINFGIIYGISAHGLAVRLGIDRAEAATFIEQYFQHYPGIRNYMEAKKQEAKEHGFITTLFGRHIHIKGINDKNHNMRAFAERQAINAPLQGTAADIIKKAMIAVSRELRVASCELILQVHDELIFEVDEAEAEIAAHEIEQIMQNIAPQISVPLIVEAGIGDHWGEIH